MIEKTGILSITGKKLNLFNENSNYCRMTFVLDRTNIVSFG